MENFILWSVSFDKKERELSFFATWVQVQRINKGTRKMVAEMIDDLGITGVSFEKWSVHHFLTNYLADNPDSDDWREVWTDTCEVKVQLAKLVKLKIKDTDLIRTYAKDNSWKGDFSPHLPGECVLVADFYSKKAVAKGEKILEMVGRLREDASLIDTLPSKVPQVPKRLFKEIREAYLEQEPQDGTPPSLTIRKRMGLPKQLVVSLGVFDEKFFRNGAKLAMLVTDLIHALDGTTTWSERTSPERLS